MTRKTAATAATLLDAPTGPLTPGVYVGVSGTPGYDFLMASTVAGATRLVGERFLPDGRKAITVLVGGAGARRQNPEEPGARKITIGREFFVTALKDYYDWKQKWWREAVQNSVDGGARNVALTSTENPDGTWTIACDDDGRGMDEDVLLNKFLVLGGTTKVGEAGAAGGFGKAKELLILPWLSWRIHSRDVVVTGVGIDYTVAKGPPRVGTRVEVVMPADNYTYDAPARAFLGKCYLPRVSFTVNGAQVDADLKASKPLQDLSIAQVYATPIDSTSYHMIVRVNGIFMFDKYIGEIHGVQVICEITAPSVQVLTANRDGFRDPSLERAISTLMVRLAKDTKSALRGKRGLFEKVYEGDPALRFRSKQEAARLIEHIGPLNGGAPREVDAVIERLAEDVETYRQQVEREGDAKPGGGLPSAGTAKVILAAVVGAGQSTLEKAAKQLVWKQDFVVINEVEGLATPRGFGKLKKFMPESMTPQIARLAKVWGELCRYVLAQLNCFPDGGYGVGFIFDQSVAAAFKPDPTRFGSGSGWLLLNPAKDYKHLTSAGSIEAWAPTKGADLKWLYAAAVHECTHMADGIEYHDEDFAAALTHNMAKVADGFRFAKQIVADNKLKDVEGVRQKRRRAPSAAERQAAVDALSHGYSTEEEADLFRTSVDVTVSSYDRAAAKEKLYQTISSRVRRAAGFVPTVAEVEEIKRGWSTAGLWG